MAFKYTHTFQDTHLSRGFFYFTFLSSISDDFFYFENYANRNDKENSICIESYIFLEFVTDLSLVQAMKTTMVGARKKEMEHLVTSRKM